MDQQDTVDVRPDYQPGEWFEVIRANSLRWADFIAELIDNSIDAGATRVEVSFENEAITVTDNGRGCEDLIRMVKPGWRADYPTTHFGRFAIGGKEAIYNMGNKTQIDSRTDGQSSTIRVCVADMIRRKTWLVGKPVIEQVVREDTGTTITISDLVKRSPPLDDLLSALGSIYQPALSNGRIQITVTKGRSKRTVRPVPEPDMTNIQQLTVDLSRGRRLSMRAGIISRPEQRRLQGVVLATECRILRDRMRLGLGNLPTPGLYIYCVLEGKSWSLNKNKIDVSDHDKEQIAATIAEELADLIEQTVASAEDVQLKNVNNVLRGVVDQAKVVRRRKAKRKSVQNPGSGMVQPTGRGGRHKRARVDQPGDTFSARIRDQVSKSSSGIQILREQRGTSDLLDMQGNYIVVINTDHPSYAEYSRLGDGDWGVVAILFACAYNDISGLDGLLTYEKEDHTDRAKTYAYQVSVLLEGYFELLAKQQRSNGAVVA